MKLPIYQLQDQFNRAIGQSHVVLSANTGSGKSTLIPVWLAERYARVMVVQPRRVAVLALSQYVASQCAFKVDHAIRFDNQINADTQIAFVTPGVALTMLAQNQLQDFDAIMLDEFHERRWDTDVLLAMLNRIDKHRLVVTSATLESDRLVDYLQAQFLHVDVPMFAVKTVYQASQHQSLPSIENLNHRVEQALRDHFKQANGDALVFLPGKKEIFSCKESLKGHYPVEVLYGAMGAQDQNRVLSSSAVPRVILATNIAETSLTIPGVTLVIDSGLERQSMQRNGRTVLALQRISKASANQRRGRAGRVQAGTCVRLYGEGAPLESSALPELLRHDLVDPILAVNGCNFQFNQLGLLDTPKPHIVQSAYQTLINMKALDEQGEITHHGKQLFPLPIDTLFSHLISAMPTIELKALTVDIVSVISCAKFLNSGNIDIDEIKELWPFGCDAYALIMLLRGANIEALSVNLEALSEAQQLARQIRSALNLPSLTHASIDELYDKTLRKAWIFCILASKSDLAFIRRERDNALFANQKIEAKLGRDSLIANIPMAHPHYQEAALILDTFSLPGKGSRQTINLANVVVPFDKHWLVESNLTTVDNTTTLTTDGRSIQKHLYAGRLIAQFETVTHGEQFIDSCVNSIVNGELFPNVYQSLSDELSYFHLWQQSTKPSAVPTTSNAEAFLKVRLSELGVESMEDVQLIEEGDLLDFDGIPEWEKKDFIEKYPLHLTLAELKLTVEYRLLAKRVIVHYQSGSRKGGPKRWELPTWQGLKIQYKKASRVVDVK